jgi:hypothetical protein
MTHDPGTGVPTITTPTGRTYTKTVQPIIEPPPPEPSTIDLVRQRQRAKGPSGDDPPF